jgi:hypothetical protein
MRFNLIQLAMSKGITKPQEAIFLAREYEAYIYEEVKEIEKPKAKSKN